MSSRKAVLRFHPGMVNEGAGICGEAAHGTALGLKTILAKQSHDEAAEAGRPSIRPM